MNTKPIQHRAWSPAPPHKRLYVIPTIPPEIYRRVCEDDAIWSIRKIEAAIYAMMREATEHAKINT